MMKVIQIHRRAIVVESQRWTLLLFVKDRCQTWVGNLEGQGEMQSDTNPTGVYKYQKVEAVAVASFLV